MISRLPCWHSSTGVSAGTEIGGGGRRGGWLGGGAGAGRTRGYRDGARGLGGLVGSTVVAIARG